MINKSVLDQIRNGVCAVGYVTVPLQEYAKDPKRPFFKVQGTGFLVRGNIVVTNRHVIEKIRRDQRETGFPDDQTRFLFVYPIAPGKWNTAFCRFLYVTVFTGVDIALVELDPNTSLGPCSPLPLGNLSSLSVTESLAVCGYPYGTSMLAPGGTLRRFGPVVQQGYLSAVSPYDVSSRIDELLLDVRTAGGMSGSPVFRPADGSVIGIHYGGWEATTSVAIPIDDKTVQQWLAVHDQNRASQAVKSDTGGAEKAAEERPDSPAPIAVMQAAVGEEQVSANNGG